MDKLSSSELEEAVKSLPGWSRPGDVLTKQIEFPSFPDLVSFLVKIAFLAEAADHHPDMLIQYRRLTINLSTHTVHGITQKDIALARQIEAALNRY